jgi:hypothetical protein
MREARIILPKLDNNGSDLSFAHAALARDLCQTWGGATASDTRGMWVGYDGTLYDEPGTAYDVAMDATDENATALRNLAVRYGRLCGQEAMYVRYACGKVEIVDTRREVAAA